MDALSERARNNYLYARTVVGRDVSTPKVQTCTAASIDTADSRGQAMQMADQHLLAVTQAQACDALNDIDLLKSAIPGCEGISRIGDGAYEVLVVAAIGPVRARFKCKLRLTEL